MKRLASTFVVLSLAVFGGLPGAAASTRTFVVNSTVDARDAVVGDGRCATSTGMCTLRAAVAEANALPGADTIQVPAGTYAIAIPPLNQNDVTTGDLDITDSLTIAGAGSGATIVDGGLPVAGAPPQVHGLDRLFEVLVDGGEVTFTGLTLSDGYAAEYGGAIMNNSTATVTITASTLRGNVAGKSGGAIDNHAGGSVDVRGSTVVDNFASENGSAINNNRDGSLTVTGSTISSNSATDVGLDEALAGAGAISNNADLDAIGTIAVSGSTMSDNRAGGGRPGAAIANDGAGTVLVSSTTFSKNIAAGDGGAISNKAGDVTVTGSTFAENAAHDGGAIYNDGALDGRVTVHDSRFSLNSASARGGAIEGGGTGTVTIFDGAFSKNSADSLGGAISSSDKASTTVVRSSFTENSGLSGGGFANEGAGAVAVENSTFANNTAFANISLVGGEGGGMHSNSGGEVAISDATFTGNHAVSGGGLSNEGGGILTVAGTRFADNRADEQGGGILIQSGAVHMRGIDVVGNVADAAEEGGGGIAYAGDKLIGVGETAALEDSRVRENKAKGQGGGIDSRGDGLLSIRTTTISGNTAAIGGAIHHVGDAPLEVTQSTLSGNFAENGGGVFSDGDGEATLENTTVSTNRAGQFGGGLLVSSRLTVRSSTVASNTAASGGGINNGGGDLIGDGSVFLANTIVANNPTGGNCVGTMTSLGGNVENADSCELRELSDQPGTDPLLGSLADNGGPTLTHELLEGSPAQERAVCTELEPCPPVDQRGIARPLFVGVDVGAFESERPPSGGPGQPCTGRMERPVPADFDSWVSQSAPSANFGSDATLKVESKPSANDRALVHFALPPVPPGCKLVGAKLRLYAASATDGHTLEARRVEGDWTEIALTWANQPGTAGPAATTQSGLGVREWDVLAQTLDMYALGNHGFLVSDADENGSGEQSFHSTEKGLDSPQLVLVFDDPDGPPRPGTCPTTPQSVPADRDSWISQGSPSNNFGGDSTLKVKSQPGYNSRALIRFPLPALPGGCTGIASATLRVEAASVKEGRTLEALRVASDWSETGVTWNNRPGTAGSAVSVAAVEGPLEWAVTAQVLDMYTSANHGFLIRDADEDGVGDEQTLNSRDKLNDGPPELVVVFDDGTPETTIDSGPPSPTDSTEASFEFSSDRPDAAFECALDGAAFQACSSPYVVRGLVEGGHRLEVRALRGVRAIDPTPASYEWKVAVAPQTTVAGPASPSASPNAVLAFSSDDPSAWFECSLDGAPFAACTSPVEYTGLADGRHEVRVRAVDAVGNADPTPATHTWTVAVPPTTTLAAAPPTLSNDPSPAFEFTANEPASFECRLDSGDWAACTSPHRLALADGDHAFEVRATDSAGNTGAGAVHAWTVDTTGPIATITSGPTALTNATSATFEFRANEPAAFECQLDSGDWAACTGPHQVEFSDGRHTFEVRATDEAGNTGASTTYTWTVDTTAPTTTIDAAPRALSNDPSPTFEFTADERAGLECRLDTGDWADCTSPHRLALSDGQHTFAVRATDVAGNTGEPASYTWTVDTTPPTTAIDSVDERSGTFTFRTNEPASFECRLDSGDWAACTSPHRLAFADGQHMFEVRATDEAGNTGVPATYSWSLDTTAPTATLDAVPVDLTNDPSALFEFTADEAASFECRLDSDDWVRCTSPHRLALTDGQHTFDVRATDEAGNTGTPASYTWTVDTATPTTTIDPIDERSGTFGFSANEPAGFECKLDTGDWTTCTSPHSYGALADGKHTLSVRATDTASNTGEPATYTWAVDTTTAPTTTISAGPAGTTNRTAATFEFTADERAGFECRLDTGDWAACTSPHEIAGPLADGDYSFEVRATDEAGNTGEPTTRSWTIDTVAPTATIDAAPPALSKDAWPSFEFTADERASFECRIDTGDWASCTSPHRLAVADGQHSFEVRATDEAGNAGALATFSWTVDTTAPTTTVDAGPADPTKHTSATFEFTADESAGFECRLDAGDWTTCTSPYEIAGPLADGDHSFEVRATDEAGNTSEPATHSWTIDTVAPTATIDAAPPALSKDASPSLEFSAVEDAGFECRLDTGDWVNCTSPHRLVLTDGQHTFDVRATDEAGNTGEQATYTWTVDTTSPTTTIEPIDERSAVFAFSANEPAGFECQLDTGDWTACTSPQSYGVLADGEHEFSVRATDTAGNTGEPATHTWMVETSPPTTTIATGPERPTKNADAAFALEANEPATFECRLDAGDWTACTSPHEYAALPDGEHTFDARATDTAGNTGETASYTWTIDTTPPTTTIEPIDERSGTSAFSANEPAGFECQLDRGDWTACTSPHTYAPLPDGEHELSVRATDAAGNTGAPATHTWTIDTIAPTTTIIDGPADPRADGSATFTFGADERASFECRLDAGDWAACTSPQSYAELHDGEHSFEVRAIDAAGHTGEAATYTWTVDTTAPVTTIDAFDAVSTSLTFSADEPASFECRLDSGEWTACASPHGYVALQDGKHTFQVRATDAAGNAGAPAAHTWTIDTRSPTTTIAPIEERSGTFAFSASEPASFECKLDAGDWTACTSPQTYTGLPDGEHTLSVRATDAAGNTGEPATHTWTIDTRAPILTIALAPAPLTNQASATFAFIADEPVDFECRLDSGDWTVCSSPHTFGGLNDGDHTVEARATDATGNTSAAISHRWTIDITAPTTTIQPVDERSGTFTFSADEPAGFECKLDSGAWASCTSPQTYAGLADGAHSLQVRATDSAGNTGAPATHRWTIDTTAPTTTIDSADEAAATFVFSADEPATFECRLDAHDWTACTSPHSYSELADGEHTFRARATDTAGNTGEAATHRWTIDTRAPIATIDSAEEPAATFTFSADEPATFECKLDAGDWAACNSPQTYTELGDGEHTFGVRATDDAGNTGDPATHTWTIDTTVPDTTAPDTTIADRPSDPSGSASATFRFTARDDLTPDAELRFECRLDSDVPADFGSCSSPQVYSGLSDGSHTFEVRAVDLAGNADATPATHTWTIDSAAPQTTITGAPPATTGSTSASFSFAADEAGTRFECSLDGAAYGACSSPAVYSGLAAGSHQFSVRATDRAGNADPTPATHTWTISVAPSCGQPVTAVASADAWTDENSPTNNKGTDSILKVQSKGPRDNFRAAVRFALPAVPTGCAVESATLRLYAASSKPARTLHALRLASAWTEHQVSWVSQLLTTGSPAVTTSGLGWRAWNVTTQVQAMFGGPNHGFLIRDAVEGQDAEQQFHSREKGENTPQLVVRFAPTAG